MRESNDTVFPVPDGISSTQWPWNKIYFSETESTVFHCLNALTDFGIQRSLKLHHVRILLRINVLIGEYHWKTIYGQPVERKYAKYPAGFTASKLLLHLVASASSNCIEVIGKAIFT